MLKRCFFVFWRPGYKSTLQTFTDYFTQNVSTYTWVYMVVQKYHFENFVIIIIIIIIIIIKYSKCATRA